MGVCAEKCAKDYNISREEQDDFAIESYKKSEIAWDNGKFSNEIVPVEIQNRKKEIENITDDEEYKNINIEKVSQLRPVFDKEGTVTAANASTLNDGASALVLMSLEKAKKLNIKPIAKVVSYSDAAHEPENFTTAPAKAIEKLLKKII